MADYTLLIDESGDFEDLEGTAPKGHPLVLGGVLAAGTPDSLRSRWDHHVQSWCKRRDVRYPPHTTELRRGGGAIVDEWRQLVTDQARGAGARWLFVVGDAPRTGDEVAFARYVRMLGGFVDLSARLAATFGATTPLSANVSETPAPSEFTEQGDRYMIHDDDRQAAPRGPADRGPAQGETAHFQC